MNYLSLTNPHIVAKSPGNSEMILWIRVKISRLSPV